MMLVSNDIDVTEEEKAEIGERGCALIRSNIALGLPHATPDHVRRCFNAGVRGALRHAPEGRNLPGGGTANWSREKWLQSLPQLEAAR